MLPCILLNNVTFSFPIILTASNQIVSLTFNRPKKPPAHCNYRHISNHNPHNPGLLFIKQLINSCLSNNDLSDPKPGCRSLRSQCTEGQVKATNNLVVVENGLHIFQNYCFLLFSLVAAKTGSYPICQATLASSFNITPVLFHSFTHVKSLWPFFYQQV